MDSIRNYTPINYSLGDLKVKIKEPKLQNVPQENHGTGQDAKPTGDTLTMTQAIAGLGQNLQVGEKVTLKMGKDEVATVEKTGESGWDRFLKTSEKLGGKAVGVAQDAIQADPAFAFRETIETVKEPLTQAAPEAIKQMAIKGLYPGMRAGVLVLDVMKAMKTVKDPNSSLLSKIIDVGHCVTDVGGLVGAVTALAGLAIPGAAVMAAAAFVGDIIAFGYHSLGFVQQQYNKYKQKHEAQGQGDNPQPKPQNQPPVPDNVKPQNEINLAKA